MTQWQASRNVQSNTPPEQAFLRTYHHPGDGAVARLLLGTGCVCVGGVLSSPPQVPAWTASSGAVLISTLLDPDLGGLSPCGAPLACCSRRVCRLSVLHSGAFKAEIRAIAGLTSQSCLSGHYLWCQMSYVLKSCFIYFVHVLSGFCLLGCFKSIPRYLVLGGSESFCCFFNERKIIMCLKTFGSM